MRPRASAEVAGGKSRGSLGRVCRSGGRGRPSVGETSGCGEGLLRCRRLRRAAGARRARARPGFVPQILIWIGEEANVGGCGATESGGVRATGDEGRWRATAAAEGSGALVAPDSDPPVGGVGRREGSGRSGGLRARVSGAWG